LVDLWGVARPRDRGKVVRNSGGEAVTVDTGAPPLVVGGPPHRRHWGRWAVAAVAAIALIVVGIAARSWWHNRVPYQAAAVHPQLVGLQVLTPTDPSGSNITAALRTLGGAKANNIVDPQSHHWQYVVGRVDVGAHKAAADSQYAVVVLDNRSHTVTAMTYSYPENGQNRAAQGWDYGLAKAGAKFSWLSPLREVGTSSGDQDPGQAVLFTPGAAVELPFFAVLSPDALPVTNLHRDLTIALIMLGPDRQVFWAKRLN
jgi:hypothetical protein